MAQQTNKQDQYGLFSVFPKFIYRGKLQTHEKWKNLIVPVIEERYKLEKGSNANKDDSPACWECDCFTTFFDKSLMDHTLEKEIDIQALLQDLSTNIQEAIKLAEFYPHAFLVAQQWFNAYGPGQNQEQHNHIPSHLSAIYYLQFDPKCHKGTSFINAEKMYTEGPRYNKHFYDPDMYGYGCYKEEMTLTCDEGDVIIFPSQLDHMVHKQPGIEKNPDGTLRISFSFNIDLVSESEAKDRLGDAMAQAAAVNPDDNTIPLEMVKEGQRRQENPGDIGSQETKEEWSSDWF
jgi:uncharacterized protein (TIGR02466 family)